MAWGHSEDVALDSGGNFSRFFSLSPQEEKVFCVRRFFASFSSSFLIFAIRCVEMLLLFCSLDDDDDGDGFWFHLWDAKFKWFFPLGVGKFSHNFHTSGPKLDIFHLLLGFTKVANFSVLLELSYTANYFRDCDFYWSYTLGLNFATLPENTLFQFSFFRSPVWPSKWVLAERRNRFFIPLTASLSDEKPFSPLQNPSSDLTESIFPSQNYENSKFPPLKRPNLAQENFHPKTHTHSRTYTHSGRHLNDPGPHSLLQLPLLLLLLSSNLDHPNGLQTVPNSAALP